jgi:nucleoside 2-deoxyribosyltransferase
MGKKNPKILDKSVCYLAGPIDFDETLGVSFRQQIMEEAKKRKMGIKFLDPTHKLESLTPDVGEEQEEIQRLKKNKSWKKLRKLMRNIVRSDLRQVDVSDFLIVMVDTSIHMCGTYHELILADLQKKPVLAIIKGGKERSSSWLFGILDPDYMFDSIEECIDYLDDVNKGKVELNHRWVLFRKELLKDG